MRPNKLLVPLAYCICAAAGAARGAPALAAAGTAPAAPASSSAAETPVSSASTLAALQAEEGAAAASAEQLRHELEGLLAQRSKLKASREPLRRELARHLDAARQAEQRYDTAAEKASRNMSPKPAPAADLERARSEYRAALERGKALQQQAKEARAVEQELAELAARARELEAKAKAITSQISDLDKRLAPALKASESQALSARGAAARARTQTGLASTAALQTTQAKLDKAIAGIDVTLSVIAKKRAQLADAPRAPAGSAPAPPAATTLGSKPCPLLAASHLTPGTYVSARNPALVLVLAYTCSAESTLRSQQETLLASALRREKVGARLQTTLLAEDGHLCSRYALAANKSGSILLSWAPDAGASADSSISAGCKSLEGEYAPETRPTPQATESAREAPAPPAAREHTPPPGREHTPPPASKPEQKAVPAPPAPVVANSGKACDIKQVDWRNFSYPDAPLKNGVHAALSPKQIQEMDGSGYWKLSEVYYADLEGDKALEALVLVECPGCGPAGSSFGSLYAYKMGAGCAPQALGEVNANGFAEGKLNGRKFVFQRNNVSAESPNDSGPSQRTESVECSVVNGKLVEKAKRL